MPTLCFHGFYKAIATSCLTRVMQFFISWFVTGKATLCFKSSGNPGQCFPEPCATKTELDAARIFLETCRPSQSISPLVSQPVSQPGLHALSNPVSHRSLLPQGIVVRNVPAVTSLWKRHCNSGLLMFAVPTVFWPPKLFSLHRLPTLNSAIFKIIQNLCIA